MFFRWNTAKIAWDEAKWRNRNLPAPKDDRKIDEALGLPVGDDNDVGVTAGAADGLFNAMEGGDDIDMLNDEQTHALAGQEEASNEDDLSLTETMGAALQAGMEAL